MSGLESRKNLFKKAGGVLQKFSSGLLSVQSHFTASVSAADTDDGLYLESNAVEPN